MQKAPRTVLGIGLVIAMIIGLVPPWMPTGACLGADQGDVPVSHGCCKAGSESTPDPESTSSDCPPFCRALCAHPPALPASGAMVLPQPEGVCVAQGPQPERLADSLPWAPFHPPRLLM